MQTPLEESTRRRHRDKLLFLMFGGAIAIVLLVVASYQLVEFTDSPAFCGRLCHQVMYPEYTAYQVSPHSRVSCSECHVGSGADYLVRSKISGMPMVFNTLLQSYHRPIQTPVDNLRPARETCENCHRPDKFSGDLVRTHVSYQPDEINTEKVDTRVLRVGGGASDAARDIHWHIAADVWYLPLDKARNEIAWVGVDTGDGALTEYVDAAKSAGVTPELLEKEKRLMDCIDCHNRATHVFKSPEQLIDQGLAEGRIDKALPYIKREASKALDPANPSLDEAMAKIEAIGEFYRVSYPRVYEERRDSINIAIDELKEVARLTTFPDMNVSWQSYPSNLGHLQSPGCFRCHGKLVATGREKVGQKIDAGCDSCHYILAPK